MNSESTPCKLRILIIEDESLIAEDLVERLVRIGFSVIASVDCAEEGIPIAVRENPDLVLMDIRLSGAIDGIQAAQQIRSQVDVPIVYLTAYSDRLTVSRAKATDFDGFILKPFQERELSSTIDVAIKRHLLRARQRIS